MVSLVFRQTSGDDTANVVVASFIGSLEQFRCCVVNDSYRNARAFQLEPMKSLTGINRSAPIEPADGSISFLPKSRRWLMFPWMCHTDVAEFPQMPGNDVLRKPVRMDDAHPQLLEKLVQGCRGLIGLGHDSRQLHERTR